MIRYGFDPIVVCFYRLINEGIKNVFCFLLQIFTLKIQAAGVQARAGNTSEISWAYVRQVFDHIVHRML